MNDNPSPMHDSEEIALMWAKYRAAFASMQGAAKRRLAILEEVSRRIRTGQTSKAAMAAVLTRRAKKGRVVSAQTVRRWTVRVRGVPREHWLPFLLPSYVGCVAMAPMSDEAWQSLLSSLAAPGAPSVATCYAALQASAAARGWQLPCLRTVQRRVASMPLRRPAAWARNLGLAPLEPDADAPVSGA